MLVTCGRSHGGVALVAAGGGGGGGGGGQWQVALKGASIDDGNVVELMEAIEGEGGRRWRRNGDGEL